MAESTLGKLIMNEFVARFIGKEVDIICGPGLAFKGHIENVNDGVLALKDSEGKHCFIATDKIVLLSESTHPAVRPGFVG
jgi:hypothetical protein